MTARIPASVLLVTQNFHPEAIGSGPYMTEIAEHLAALGTRVDVLTVRPNYPDGAVRDGYRRGERDWTNRNGVNTRRLRPLLLRGRGAAARLAFEGAFLIQGLAAIATGRVRRGRLVLSLCPSIFSVILGNVAAMGGRRHVAIVHDIQSGLASGLQMMGKGGGGLVSALRWIERQALNRADLVFVLSEPMREQLRDMGVRTSIETLPIWIDTDAIVPRSKPLSDATVTVLYSGNLGKKQDLDQVLGMTEILQRRRLPIRVVLRGQGSEADALKRRARDSALRNLSFEPLAPAEHLAESLAQGDIHLVPQHPDIADFAVPSKVFGIMAAGRPFVAAAPRGSMLWRLRDESDAFRCVPSGDAEGLANSVEALANDASERARLGANGRRFACAVHARDRVLESLRARLDRLEA